MARNRLLVPALAGLIAGVPLASAADGLRTTPDDSRLFPDPYDGHEDYCENLLEANRSPCVGALPSPSQSPDPAWARFELDALQRERRDLHIGRPSFGIALSVLGVAAGAWILAVGVEGSRRPVEPCGDETLDETWCFSRTAPYAGSVLTGISVFGLARSGKQLRKRATRRRQLNRQIREIRGHARPP